MSRPPLRHLALTLGLAAVLGLAACADDQDLDASAAAPTAAATPSATTSAASFPLVIAQSAGDVTIPAAPQRVVALDFPSADAAIALGVVPVAMAELSYLPGGVQEWTKDALAGAGPELFGTDEGFPFETLARLDPDVILATNAFPLVADSWKELNAIAPVVAHADKPGQDDWQDGVRKVAAALGRVDQGERLIADAQDAAAEAARAHPEFAGKTASFFNYVRGDGLDVISSNDDVSMRFIRALGFAGAPEAVTDLAEGAAFDGARAEISPERYDLLAAGVILGTTSGPDTDALTDLRTDPLFTRVPAVARGSFLGFGIGPATAMAFPSVLSVPYAVRELLDDLAGAVSGRATTAPSTSPS